MPLVPVPYQKSLETCKAKYRWTIRPVVAGQADALGDRMRISPITARVMLARGIDPDDESAEKVLKPTLDHLHRPYLLADMDTAAKRLADATRSREKIVIYGDYDADGTCAAAILATFLEIADADVSVIIPEREKDGYGLSVDSTPDILAREPKLLVTVDNGTSAVDAVAELKKHGVDVIVTDHHLPGDTLPDALAVINPMRRDCHYPFKYLSGAGVAYKLAWAVAVELSGGREKVLPPFRKGLINALPFVALATISDMMPILDENRPIIRMGLRLMRTAPSPGIEALLALSRIKTGKLTPDAIAYQLGPRINAAGRMGFASVAYNLLRADNPETANTLAKELDQLNVKRRSVENAIVKQAATMVPDPAPPGIALAGDAWHTGVLGIVAGRLAKQFVRPAALVHFDESGIGKGSCRSVPGINMKDILDSCKAHLEQYGGHEQAAGLTVRRENWDAFVTAFYSACKICQPDGAPSPSLETDGEVDLADCTFQLCRELDEMEPYGIGYPKPLFIARNVRIISDIRPMGKNGNHWQFRARQDDGPAFRAVGFGMGARRAELEKRRREGQVDFVFEPALNHFNGRTSVELYIKDISESGRDD